MPGKVVVAKSSSSLVIVSPNRGQRVLLSPDLAADRQQVLLEASTGEGGIWWFVDDELVGRERRMWWSPTAGPHRIRAVDGEGHSAEVTVDVQL
jgi:membrane carboxypeptidase/penicillin-binding protein PbpC